MNPKTTFIVTEPFEAARHVGVLPEGHRSRSMHGHSFLASVHSTMPAGIAAYPGGEIDTIKARLKQQVQKLDYSLLNDVIQIPTNENIARWIQAHCYVPGTESTSIQSTVNEGLELDIHGTVHVWRRYYFQAAHQLPNVPAGHKCGNMHGHGFSVLLQASRNIGICDPSIDYDILDKYWQTVFLELDHVCLNNISGLENPTSELISQWIWLKLKPVFTELSAVTVYETASCGASYDGEKFQIWKEFTLDSSVIFRNASNESKRRKLHGYTYTMRLHLTAPLDQLMGWAIDFGDVKEKFNPTFKLIDHSPLHLISDLSNPDVANFSKWIMKKSKEQLPEVYRVDVFETKGCGALTYINEKGPTLPI